MRWESCFALSGFLYQAIRNNNLEYIGKLTTGENIFVYDKLFFPICANNHRTFAAIYVEVCIDDKSPFTLQVLLCLFYESLPFNTYRYYDSRYGKGEVHISRLKSYLEKTYKDKLGKQLLGMKCELETSFPEQKHGYDCAGFVR